MDKVEKIKLTKGKYAIVDKEDFGWINQWKWQYGNIGYAYKSLNKKTKIYMHQLVNNTPKGFETDHINRNKLDNRKSNLRSVTKQINGFNRGLNRNNTSGYKGVCWVKNEKRWMAHIKIDYKLINLGRFENIEDAISARKQAETLYI